MNRTTLRLTKHFALVAAVAAIAAPSASAAFDVRSPVPQDRAAQSSPAKSQHYTDVRSPDARDGNRAFPSAPVQETGDSTGFDWGIAGIVAGGFALLLLAAGSTLVVIRRRGHAVPQPGPRVGTS
jgi:hypothetical protein